MKTLKKLITVALCMALSLSVLVLPSKAEASERTTYLVHADGGKWYYMKSTDANNWADASGLNNAMVDGDAVVIDGVGNDAADLTVCTLDITKRIGELAIAGGATGIVNAAGGVDLYYVTGGATGVVNGNVAKATASNQGILQVNGNVQELEVSYPVSYQSTDNDPKFAVQGKVNKATVKVNSECGIQTVYDIANNKAVSDKFGIIWLSDGEYSKETTASVNVAEANTTTAKTQDKELDDVPKTGSAGMATSLAFFAMAAILAVSAVVLKRRED